MEHEAKLYRNERNMIWMCGFDLKERKIESLKNYWDWKESAWQLGGTDYRGLDMLNVTMMQIGSRSVCVDRDYGN